jgi:FKBP-type peptidyl-prolyl cis-trans isomerase
MSTTRKRDRALALFMAIFFFVLASALTIMVIYQAVTTKNNTQASNTTPTTAKQTVAGTQLSGFTPVANVPSLKITDTKVGGGAAAKAGATVTVDYTGAVAGTGIVFQSTKDSGQPVSVTLKGGPQGVIEGWALGVPGMKVGGSRQLLIPANEAYGASPPQGSGIPANAPLVFDITLVKVGS